LKLAKWVLLLPFAPFLACSAGTGSATSDGTGVGNGDPNGTGSGGDSNVIGGMPSGNTGNVGTVDPNNPNACQGESSQAEKTRGGKADIIWIIDNSGSMFTESVGIQNNMNNFSSFILSTGIDVHVAIISVGPPLFGLAPPYGVSIPAPLGSGQAYPNDSNPPVFMHVQPTGGDAIAGVQSHDLLFQLEDTFPTWQSMLRPDSTKTIVIVTDDENNPAPTGPDFKTFFDQKFTGSTWRFSGIFCQGPTATAAGSNCSGDGQTYFALVNQTQGIWADLSSNSPDWNAIFKQLADAVVADAKPVDCTWTIPPAPNGKTLDPNKVNVSFTPSSGQTQSVYGVGTKDACTDKYLGWYFDDPSNPKQIISCPQSCTVLQSDDQARIDVKFGCVTESAPIM
jgi:hypothetical protein